PFEPRGRREAREALRPCVVERGVAEIAQVDGLGERQGGEKVGAPLAPLFSDRGDASFVEPKRKPQVRLVANGLFLRPAEPQRRDGRSLRRRQVDALLEREPRG